MKRKQISSMLIGAKVEIISSNNPTLIGVKGNVTDETKFTLTIESKQIIKKQATFKINEDVVEGVALIGRPEERIKNS